MSKLLGISSSYFTTHGLNIYDSVKRAAELGFETVELGAAHKFEPNVWKTVKKIKKDFPELNFTVHGLFPPQKERFWFNAAHGLIPKNKHAIDNLFKAASIVEAIVVGIHPGFASEMEWGEQLYGFNIGKVGEKIEREKAMNGLEAALGYASKLSNSTGIKFAVENIPNTPMGALIYSKMDFQKIFENFPNMGFLLDVGHALFENNLTQLLELSDKVCEIHLHYSAGKGNVFIDDHCIFPKEFNFSHLKRVKQLKRIPLIFEHGNNVSEQQLLEEKKMLENFLRGH